MRGLLKLTWLEIRIFMREPLGFVGGIGVPLALFLLLGRSVSRGAARSTGAAQFLAQDLPLFVSLFISINAALSLIAVISIYREGGILKRLRATPLRLTCLWGNSTFQQLDRAGRAEFTECGPTAKFVDRNSLTRARRSSSVRTFWSSWSSPGSRSCSWPSRGGVSTR